MMLDILMDFLGFFCRIMLIQLQQWIVVPSTVRGDFSGVRWKTNEMTEVNLSLVILFSDTVYIYIIYPLVI